MGDFIRLTSIKIDGYRPFRELKAPLGPLEVIVGANGSGKSSLFEFLRFMRDSVSREIPPGIIPDPPGREIFHVVKPQPKIQSLGWGFEMHSKDKKPTTVIYQGWLAGPAGFPQVMHEHVRSYSSEYSDGSDLMEIEQGNGYYAKDISGYMKEDIKTKRNQLTLSMMTNPKVGTLYSLREYFLNWGFYDANNIDISKIRQPTLIEQEPVLLENAGNLSSVLHYLMTEHKSIFDQLQEHLRWIIPGFESLTVKARGGPGQVLAYWKEKGVEGELTLADLSDGIIRLICWFVLCLHPKPPTLICIDEPELGVHPRTMPVLAGLIEKATERTQLIVATHSSYFLTQFDIKYIAVMRKENGEAKFIKPGDSAVIKGILEDFGPEEIEALHLSDELELLP